MCKSFIAILLLLFISLIPNSAFTSQGGEYCYNAIVSIEEKYPLGTEEKLNEIELLNDKCIGTGLYEYHLGKLYLELKKYDKAEEEFDRGLSTKNPYAKELFLAKGDRYLGQHQYANSEKHYRKVVQKYPDWFDGYHYLGFSLFAQGDYLNAAENLEKANSLFERGITHRHLILCYYSLNQYEKSIESLKAAFKFDSSILTDRDAVVTGARSYAELGKFDLSLRLLQTIMDKRPEIVDDEEFLKAGLFLEQKMAKAK